MDFNTLTATDYSQFLGIVFIPLWITLIVITAMWLLIYMLWK